MKMFLWIVVVAVLGGTGWYFLGARGSRAATTRSMFRTAKVERGDVVEGVAASGTVQPVVLVQVGTQVSGVIEKLFVDFNAKVKAGQTIAVLDSRRMASQVAQDDAAIDSAKASLERIKATVIQDKANLDRTRAIVAQSESDVERVQALLTQAQHDLERQKILVEKKLTAPSDFDAAVANAGSFAAQLKSSQSTVLQNRAQIAVGEATILQDESQVKVAEAAVTQAVANRLGDKVNLDYATIVSPVDGVVVSRNVDVGQTVAASLSAPTLFLIAQDLTKVQIQTSVPEADVGKLHEAQKVHFTVDAYTDKTFEGVVSQVRLASTTVSNVVTYTVIVDASNPDGLLFPGMTANATFEIQRSEPNSLKIPATALRLQPAKDLLDVEPAATPDAEREGGSETAAAAGKDGKDGEAGAGRERAQDGAAGGGGAGSGAEGGRRGSRGGGASGAREGGDHAWKGGGGHGRKARKVYIYALTADNHLHAIAVTPGLTDGISTIVVPADASALEEGTEVVTAILRADEPATTNPFAPPRMGGGGGGRGGR